MSYKDTPAENLRRIIHTKQEEYQPYDFAGPTIDGIYQLDLTLDKSTGQGAYMIKMAAGTETTPHVHNMREQYLIIEGDVVESDGTTYGPGDYIIYESGSEHSTRTINGCVIIGFDYPAP